MNSKLFLSGIVFCIVIICGCISEQDTRNEKNSIEEVYALSNTSSHSDEEEAVLNQGCYYYSPRDVWICDNYQESKSFIQSSSPGDMTEPRMKEVGIANTTGNYVLLYAIPDFEEQVQFFEIYDPSETVSHDLGFLEDVEELGITITSYEAIWNRSAD